MALATSSAIAWQARVATDQRGRRHTFTAPAQRVVTIAIPLLWTYMTVDGSEKHLVGANPIAASQMRDGIVSRVFPGAGRIPTTITRGGDFNPNIEALLALRPDAVFQWADRGPSLIEALDAAGLRTLGVKNTNSESDIEEWVRMSGAVSGRVARADSLIRNMQSGNRRFEALTNSIPDAKRPKVLVVVEYSRRISVNGPRSYAALSVRRAGGVNAATVDGDVSIEQVLRWNPDVILLTSFEAFSPADLIADPKWSKTSAAKSKRVYRMPFGVTRWGGYGPESSLYLAWLTTLLHPDIKGIALRDEMRAAFQSLYNYKLMDADIDQILQMSVNKNSAGYSRFLTSSR